LSMIIIPLPECLSWSGRGTLDCGLTGDSRPKVLSSPRF
jgi:hypothetical protein